MFRGASQYTTGGRGVISVEVELFCLLYVRTSFWLQGKIDKARVNRKPSADQSRFISDIATKLYTLDVILRVQFVLDIVATKLYTLDVMLEYSKARIREGKISNEHTEARQIDFDRDDTAHAVHCDAPSNICKYTVLLSKR